jgi:hypothetical protein
MTVGLAENTTLAYNLWCSQQFILKRFVMFSYSFQHAKQSYGSCNILRKMREGCIIDGLDIKIPYSQSVHKTTLQLAPHKLAGSHLLNTGFTKKFPCKAPGDKVNQCNFLLWTWFPGALQGNRFETPCRGALYIHLHYAYAEGPRVKMVCLSGRLVPGKSQVSLSQWEEKEQGISQKAPGDLVNECNSFWNTL